MSVDIAFPLEFIVEGVPVAPRAESRNEWKELVQASARAALQEGHWATEQPVAVTILYFPEGRMGGDIDNIVKPILDALEGIVYINDRQVDRVWVQKFEPDRPFAVSRLTERLGDAVERRRPIVYIRVDDDTSFGGAV